MLIPILATAAIIIIAAFVVVVAVRPSDFRITRSALISSPAISVFALVNDFRKWEAWSPWAKIDPAMKQTYAGAPSGTGAEYFWSGNRKAGEGRMTIEESAPGERLRIKLEFIKPFPSVCSAEFRFVPESGGTRVEWSLSGRHTFVPKAFSLIMNMDKMVGSDFEKGLAQLKALAESPSPGA